MPDPSRDRKILETLAQSLPEKVLLELLPGEEPEKVRQLLVRLAANESADNYPRQHSVLSHNDSLQARIACTLYTDGASRGNPGDAGAGAVLIGPDGAELGTRSLFLGQCTNNVAEYRALLVGLELAEEYGCKVVHICLDSELIVRQIQGAYKVKNEHLKPLFDKVTTHLEQFERWDVKHVPREENARADELANRGIDSQD